MTSPSGKSRNLDQIAAFLLGDEHRRLDTAETVALRVDEFVGSSARLAAATAETLVDALRTRSSKRAQGRRPG